MDFNRQLFKVEILFVSQCFVTVLCLPMGGLTFGSINTQNNLASALNPFHRLRELPSIVPRQPADIPRVSFQMPLTEPFLLRGNGRFGNTFNILTEPRIVKEEQNSDKDDTQNAIVFEQPTEEGHNTEIPIKNIEDNDLSKDIIMEIFATFDNSTLPSTTDFDYSGTTDDYTTTTDEDLLNRSAISGAALSTLLGR